MLLTGGSAVVILLNGVLTAVMCFLLPVGIVLYITFGGIKATYLKNHSLKMLVFYIGMEC